MEVNSKNTKLQDTFNFRYYVLTVLGRKIMDINWRKFNDHYYIDFLTVDGMQGSLFPEYADYRKGSKALGYIIIVDDALERITFEEFNDMKPTKVKNVLTKFKYSKN